MSNGVRDPLKKEGFLEGTRQKWFAIILVYVLGIILANGVWGIDPAPYMNFLLVSVPIFIGSLTVSSFNKERARMNKGVGK
jgi:hypothetical protein